MQLIQCCLLTLILAVRAGDYYMFDDVDEKFELDVIDDSADYLDDTQRLVEAEKKIVRRKTLLEGDYLSARRSESLSAEDRPTGSIQRKSRKTLDEGASTSSAAASKLATEEIDSDSANEMKTPSKVKERLQSIFKKTDKLRESKKDGVDEESESVEELQTNPIVKLCEAFLISLMVRLNRFSRNYRYTNRILSEEKRLLKQSRGFIRAGRTFGSDFLALMRDKMRKENEAEAEARDRMDLDEDELYNMSRKQYIQSLIEDALKNVDSHIARQHEQQAIEDIHAAAPKVNAHFIEIEEDFATRDHNIFIEVLIAAWYALLANTDIICYMVVFLNQVANATITSLPLPLMVFLWGTISLPRPTKTFWVTMITYTQAVVLMKGISRCHIIWAQNMGTTSYPFSAAKIFGMDGSTSDNYDLILLLSLFLHRFILKTQGLWKSDYQNELDPEGELHASKADNADEREENKDSKLKESTEVEVKAEVVAEAEVEHKIEKEGEEDEEELQSHVSDEHSDKRESGASVLKMERCKYFSSVIKFFNNLLRRSRLPTDVYALMFLCDFVNFFVLLFGFTAFGSQQEENSTTGGVQTYLAENKVPIPFLIMLLLQFILIVIDRALYLRKALLYKIFFHFFFVIGIHICMFFIVPLVTERTFYSLAPPVIFYIIKCFNMLLSSYQIKSGYPKRVLGNFLTRSFALPNMISFKVYMQIPFLFELRTVLDWVCTDTTMTLFDWLKMEDIFADIYFIKCSRQIETDFPALRATKKPLYIKLLIGGTVILLIVIGIWGPLSLFALGKAVGQTNTPIRVDVRITIGSYASIYEAEERDGIESFSNAQYAALQALYSKNRPATDFLQFYDPSDITSIGLSGTATSTWGIAPPELDKLKEELKNSDIRMVARFSYNIKRLPPSKDVSEDVSSEVSADLTEANKADMLAMLTDSEGDALLVIQDLVPKFIKVLNSMQILNAHELLPKKASTYRPLVLKMLSSSNNTIRWWNIADYCADSFYRNTLSKWPNGKCDSGVVLYAFNDKKFPSSLRYITGGGIIGIYTTAIFVASRFLKNYIGGSSRKIMYEDLPYVDRVFQLCLDIYLVREAREFALEEDLFAKLVFLYRSPETMIKWTRPKEEPADEETDSESVRSRMSGRHPVQHHQAS